MINVKTLSAIYASHSNGEMLTAIQTISLHLLLHRPRDDEDSYDPKFGPYISTMPRDFDSHPLAWSVKKSVEGDSDLPEIHLLDCLPPGVMSLLRSLVSRFWEDWRAICQFSVRPLIQGPSLPQPPPAPQRRFPGITASSSRRDSDTLVRKLPQADTSLVGDFVWAWLNGLQSRHSCSP